MGFYVDINKDYFEKVLEIKRDLHTPEEAERIVRDHLNAKRFTPGKKYPVLAIKEKERETLLFIPDDNKFLNWHNKIEFLFAGVTDE